MFCGQWEQERKTCECLAQQTAETALVGEEVSLRPKLYFITLITIHAFPSYRHEEEIAYLSKANSRSEIWLTMGHLKKQKPTETQKSDPRQPLSFTTKLVEESSYIFISKATSAPLPLPGTVTLGDPITLEAFHTWQRPSSQNSINSIWKESPVLALHPNFHNYVTQTTPQHTFFKKSMSKTQLTIARHGASGNPHT